MRELLLAKYRTDLLSVGMDSCRNFEHLLEAALQQCIVKVGSLIVSLTYPVFLVFLLSRCLSSCMFVLRSTSVVVARSNRYSQQLIKHLKKTPAELGIRVC